MRVEIAFTDQTQAHNQIPFFKPGKRIFSSVINYWQRTTTKMSANPQQNVRNVVASITCSYTYKNRTKTLSNSYSKIEMHS